MDFRRNGAALRGSGLSLHLCHPGRQRVLPGGGRIGGFLHQARTVCRRAERDIWVLHREEAVNERLLAYVNRLSDLLFVLSRWVGRHLGETEYLWERALTPRPRRRAAAKSAPKTGGRKRG